MKREFLWFRKEIEEKDKISFQMNNTLQGGIDSNDNMIKAIEERQENNQEHKIKGSERK